MKWVFAIVLLAALLYLAFDTAPVDNGGVPPTVSNLVYNLDANTVSFDTSYPVHRVGNQSGECWGVGTHWDCPRPNGGKMRLSVTP